MSNLLLAGAVSGSIYALLAVGLIVIYRSSRVLNFAHGALVGVAAFVALTLYAKHDVPLVPAFALTIVTVLVVTLAVEVIVVAPLRGATPLEVIVATLAVALVLSGLLTLVFGPEVQLFPRFVGGQGFSLGGTTITFQNLVTIAGTLIILGAVAMLFQLTRLGVQMRAASEDPRLAALLGVSPHLVSFVSWGIGGALAGVAAILVAPDISLTPDAFTVVLVQSFAAVVVGGFTSMLGAIVGGYVVGIGLNLFSYYVASALPATFILVVVLMVLIVRPYGLFGHQETVRL